MEVAEKKEVMMPKLRFGGFTESWIETTLGNMLTFKNGVNASKEQYGSGYKFINVLDIIENDFITHDVILGEVELSDKEVEKNEVKYGDILFQRSSETREEVGQANVYLDKEKTAVFGGFVIRGSAKAEYNPSFMNGMLKTNQARKEITTRSGGSTRYNIGQASLEAVTVFIPALPEQKKIADFLSAVDARIQHLNRKKELLETYKKGVMQKLFSQELRFKQTDGTSYADWEEKRLGGRTSLLKDGTHGTHIDHPGTGYLLLSAKNIVNGNIQFDSSDREISETDYKQIYKNYHLQKGDVLLSVVGTIGRSCLWTNETNIAFQRSVAFFRFSEDNSQFIYQQFNTVRFQNELKRRQVVSAQPGIYLGDLSKIPLLIPSIEEQQKIADFLSSLDKKIGGVNAQIEKTQQFKKGLLQEMFV